MPHFIGSPGYVYAYAYGQLLALSVYRLYSERGDEIVPGYLEMLSAGGSRSPEELGELVGVDLRDPGFWDNGLDLVEEQLRRRRAGGRSSDRRAPVARRATVFVEQVVDVERPQQLCGLALAGVGDVVDVGHRALDVGVRLVEVAGGGFGRGQRFDQLPEELDVEMPARVLDGAVVQLLARQLVELFPGGHALQPSDARPPPPATLPCRPACVHTLSVPFPDRP